MSSDTSPLVARSVVGAQAAERRRAALRERFEATVPEVIARFRACAASLGSGPAAPAAVAALWRETHRVHCAARSHGFVDASRLAGAFERRVRGWAGDAALEHDDRAAAVAEFAAAMEAALATSTDDSPGAPRAP
jgi:chemotaxis protein histidine kinase CheA